MSFKIAVCFLLIVLQFVDARPVRNLGILSNEVSNTIYNLNKTHYAYDSPLRFSFSLDAYPEEPREVSIRQPALKLFQTINQFRHSSTYSSGSVQQTANDQRFGTLYRNSDDKINEFEYPMINGTLQQNNEDWLEQIDTRLLEIRKRFGEMSTEPENLKNRFRSVDRHGQFFETPYYTLNEDHTIVKKHDMIDEVTGSSDSIVKITEVPMVTLKIEENWNASTWMLEITGTSKELKTEVNVTSMTFSETTMKSDYVTSVEEDVAEEVFTVATTEEVDEMSTVTWLSETEKILSEEDIEAIFMDPIVKTDSMNLSLESTTSFVTSAPSFDGNTVVGLNLSLVEASAVLPEEIEVRSAGPMDTLKTEYIGTEKAFVKFERSTREGIFKIGKIVDAEEKLIEEKRKAEDEVTGSIEDRRI